MKDSISKASEYILGILPLHNQINQYTRISQGKHVCHKHTNSPNETTELFNDKFPQTPHTTMTFPVYVTLVEHSPTVTGITLCKPLITLSLFPYQRAVPPLSSSKNHFTTTSENM
jgi:hypothetical protein